MANRELDFIDILEIHKGMMASYSQTITESDIEAFASVSGDRNPVHLDERYAKKSQFKGRIAHGMLTASFFSQIFGTIIPGRGCVYVSQSLRFRKPVYIGDTIEARVTVVDVILRSRRIIFETVCIVDGEIVTDGRAELYQPEDGQ